MQIAIYHTDSLSDDVIRHQIDALMPLVPPQRREEALRYKSPRRQFDTIKSFCMLQELVGHPLPDWQTNEHGKPYYDPALSQLSPSDLQLPTYFSISHCSAAIAVAVSDHPVGIDVETINRRITPDLIRYTMNNDEQSAIFATLNNQHSTFFRFWTRKEAYLKLIGTGINGDMKDVLLYLPPHITITTTPYPRHGIILSIAQQQ